MKLYLQVSNCVSSSDVLIIKVEKKASPNHIYQILNKTSSNPTAHINSSFYCTEILFYEKLEKTQIVCNS